ncbi:MAG: DUF1232 domain-containing protein [Opitutaceae bacterium]|nr:DUF1232 domain-containing protein [Cytophagales bacterium]
MSFLLNIRNKFRLLRSDLPVLYLASKDKRTPITTKLLIGLTVVYFFSPIDLVPDFIPVLGFVDDLLMVPFLVSMAVKTVPVAVLADARARLNSRKSKMKNGLLILIIIVICVVAGYYGYQYYNSTDY